MYEVSVEDSFSAAHRLRMADGMLEPPHGHDWQVRAEFRGDSLDGQGLLIDFVEAQRQLKSTLERLHHTDLNENPMMAGLNPSAELVAKVIFDALAQQEALKRHLYCVTVGEAPGCTAGYFGPDHPHETAVR